MNVAERQRGCQSQLLSSHNARDLLDSVDAFLFDCDGLIPLTLQHIYFSSDLKSQICCIYYQIHNWVLLFIGVIWKGDTLIDGVSHTLDMLRSKAYTLTLSFLSQIYEFLISFFFFLILYIYFQGKKLVFVTNNSTKSRSQYAKKFHSLGISVSEVCFVSNTKFSKVHSFFLYMIMLLNADFNPCFFLCRMRYSAHHLQLLCS